MSDTISKRNFENKTALITGSTQGIGLAIAKALNEAGANVILNSAKSFEKGKRLAEEWPRATYIQADISNEDEASDLIEQSIKKHKKLDILVNNAGMSYQIPFEDLSAIDAKTFNTLMHFNVYAQLHLSRAAYPFLEKQSGQILNISSVAGLKPVGSSIPYALSKAALNHLTTILATVMAPKVRVNAIAPGFIRTERTQSWKNIEEKFTKESLLKKAGTVEDVAACAIALLKNPFIDGQVITLDGGFSAR